jgi:tRNA pseudouridine38-40 synthase
VVHFDDPVGRSLKAWVMGTNRHLPADIRVHWAQEVGEAFHARFSATARRYRYIICNTSTRPALLHNLVTWYRHALDVELMNDAAETLLGEHDFSAFRAASCQASSPNRCVTACTVTRQGDYVVVDITANAFLHHMVRNIVGSLLAVGSQSSSVEWFEMVLRNRDRTQAADTAPAEGLYLVSVAYPAAFGLPETPDGPTLLWGRL